MKISRRYLAVLAAAMLLCGCSGGEKIGKTDEAGSSSAASDSSSLADSRTGSSSVGDADSSSADASEISDSDKDRKNGDNSIPGPELGDDGELDVVTLIPDNPNPPSDVGLPTNSVQDQTPVLSDQSTTTTRATTTTTTTTTTVQTKSPIEVILPDDSEGGRPVTVTKTEPSSSKSDDSSPELVPPDPSSKTDSKPDSVPDDPTSSLRDEIELPIVPV